VREVLLQALAEGTTVVAWGERVGLGVVEGQREGERVVQGLGVRERVGLALGLPLALEATEAL
jgi:hypothetical protein